MYVCLYVRTSVQFINVYRYVLYFTCVICMHVCQKEILGLKAGEIFIHRFVVLKNIFKIVLRALYVWDTSGTLQIWW